jgi:hypothetical protein
VAKLSIFHDFNNYLQKVSSMKIVLSNFGIIMMLFLLIGCTSETTAPVPVEAPVMPPQDSGAGKNTKSRIPPQTGKVPASK